MQGPLLNTLQNDGVHGCPSSTLQGACENGVASIWRRCWASAVFIPTKSAIRRTARRQNMWAAPHGPPQQTGAAIGPHQGRRRSNPRAFVADSSAANRSSAFAEDDSGVWAAAGAPYAFFFTSLTLEKLMPSARSRV